MAARSKLAVLGACVFCLTACAKSALTPSTLHYRRVALSPEPVEQELLPGPPATAGMRSGRVVLKPGEQMHRHSTNDNEEFLVFLRGKARVVLGAENATLEAGQVLYIPPNTEHELFNDGPDELRYIYTVAPAAQHR